MSIESHAKDWVGYRPQIKVIDCTIRDGGLMNNHHFTDEVVRGVYRACALGGIDYVEIGYKNSEAQFSRDEHGPWKFCSEDDVRRICGVPNYHRKVYHTIHRTIFDHSPPFDHIGVVATFF